MLRLLATDAATHPGRLGQARPKVDQRKPDDVARWIEHQVKHGQAPDLAILHGAQFGPVVVGKCDELGLAWIAVGGDANMWGFGPTAAVSLA